jgi:hypothetical protein
MGKTLKGRDKDHGENCRCKKCRAREEALSRNKIRNRVSSFKGITWEDDFEEDDYLYERRRQNY